MSRGFVKEGDQEEVPMVPPRAHLPAGVTNYVTPHGFNSLKEEESTLLEEIKHLSEQSDKDNRVQINHIRAKLNLLQERIRSAKVVEPSSHSQEKVRFGAKVTLYKEQEKSTHQYQIVGVDEANFGQNKISFLSPMAKVLLNKKVGDTITLQAPVGQIIMRIEAIEYDAE